MSRRYAGIRHPEFGAVVSVVEGVRRYPLPERLDLANHSPDGFEWGYAGSGPAQLALALLADAVGDEFALKHYGWFKQNFVYMKLPRKTVSWDIPKESLLQFLRDQGKLIDAS